MDKPNDMFDRDFEWSQLLSFASDPRPGATLGVISGRRRQGKTYLLRAACQALGGFYFAAEEAADAESLRSLGKALGEYLGLPVPLALADWAAAVDALLALGRDRPTLVVIDEFPYLVRANSTLPSVIQNALMPLRDERDGSRSRLLLCGSAMSFMGRLLAGNAPLRGRAGLEMVVPTLDHQLAAEFWGITDPRLAVLVNAIVGGTPAYRREFVRDDVPAGMDDFDAWVARTVLSPASPLFREARYLLADEPDLRDAGLYHSVLAAIAQGHTTRGGIASYLGKKSGDLGHPLTVLEDAGLVDHEADVFKDNRTTFRIAEPLITFYHAVMRPIWSDLEYGRDTDRLWERSQKRFVSGVVGPHFERLCRFWLRHMAGPELLGDHPNRVGSGTVNDPAARTLHEVDVVAFGLTDQGSSALRGIGEVKWNVTMGMGHLDRLRHIRALVNAKGLHDTGDARLICFSGAGFTDELHQVAADTSDVVLVSATDLYGPLA